jgi:hypothetical protein
MSAEETRAELRVRAEKQAAAYARMLELGGGVGLLGIENREMFDDMCAWDDLSENDHADVVLGLIDQIRELEERQASRKPTDPRDVAHIECDCVPHLGPSHCHLCSKREGREVPWPEAHGSREVTDAEEEAAAHAMWSAHGGSVCALGSRCRYAGGEDADYKCECAECAKVWREMARAALVAAREVRS